MEASSTKKEGRILGCLNNDVLRLILDSLYEMYLRDFDRYESTRAKQVNAVKKLLPLGYTSRSFAKLVLPYVWQYVRIVTNSLYDHNVEIFDILSNDNLLFPYGDYLKELEINLTVYNGDERCQRIPVISSLLQVVAKSCMNIQQLSFLAKVEYKNVNEYCGNTINHPKWNNSRGFVTHKNIHEYSMQHKHDENTINQTFQRYQAMSKWNNFRDLVSSAFGQGSLVEVTLSSDFVLMDDECLISIAQKNPGIRKLSLRGSQFTHRGMETALQYLGGSLRKLEIHSLLGDGSIKALTSLPLSISIDSLLRPCRNLQSIYLVGIRYQCRPVDSTEKYTCPLQSVTTRQVDEETLKQLFSLADKRTLSQVNITCPYNVVKWDSFLRSSILPICGLENLILLMLRCQNHRYSSCTLDPKIIMKNIMDTLQISENTTDLLCSKLKQWKILVGKDTGDQMYSVESEGVDFVSRICILDYDRLALSEYCY